MGKNYISKESNAVCFENFSIGSHMTRKKQFRIYFRIPDDVRQSSAKPTGDSPMCISQLLPEIPKQQTLYTKIILNCQKQCIDYKKHKRSGCGYI